MDPDLLKLLCCPETRQGLRLAEKGEVDRLNGQVAAGTLQNRAGRQVPQPLDEGLVRADGKLLYAVRQSIPVMLSDEAIPLA